MVPNGGNENRVLSASRSCPATSFLKLTLVFDSLQQRLQAPRAIPRRNPFQRERGGLRRVDSIVSRGRGAVASRHHPTAHVRVPVAVRIAEVLEGPAESILHLLLARED